MAARRSKVLIVDDEDNIVLALHRVLYQDNDRYDVLLARSAEIAQQILADVSGRRARHRRPPPREERDGPALLGRGAGPVRRA